MIKTAIGFILGIAAALYGKPYIESFLDTDFSGIATGANSASSVHVSNTLNSERVNFSFPDSSGTDHVGPNEIMTAMYLTSYFVANGHGDDPAPDAVLRTINQLAQSNAIVRDLLTSQPTSHLSNSRALKVLQGSLANG